MTDLLSVAHNLLIYLNSQWHTNSDNKIKNLNAVST